MKKTCVSVCNKQQLVAPVTPETETLNNFCPSRFSQVCPDFPFLKNTNSVQKVCTDFQVTVQICISDQKILTHFLYCFARKGKSGHTSESLDGQKLLRVSDSAQFIFPTCKGLGWPNAFRSRSMIFRKPSPWSRIWLKQAQFQFFRLIKYSELEGLI